MATTVYTCTNCGGNLEFKAGAGSLVCPYCGTANEAGAEEAPQVFEELDFDSALRNLEGAAVSREVKSVGCSACGATVTLEPNETTGSCLYCGTTVVAQTAAKRVLEPQYILPFRIERDDAKKRFTRWIGSRRFAPNALKRYARVSEPISGVYYPFWTFDAGTRSEYSGMRGVFYTEQIRTRDREGRMVTRSVTKTRWYPASGVVSRLFDDVLVPASNSLEAALVNRFQSYPLSEMVVYDTKYLPGYRAESYSVELRDGFADAKSRMEEQIQSDVRRDIGGDTQRIVSLRTVYSGVTFKYVVLPVYAMKYKFRNRFFPVLINGVTGEIVGKRPYSWIKITALVAVIAAVVVGGYFLLRYFGVV